MQQKNQPKNKTVLISAINDLTTDQRLHKVACSMMKIGLEPTLIGIRFKSSARIENRPYKIIRLPMIWKKGPLFYMEFNLRLFLFLLFKRALILISNDLDTLLANYSAYRLKKIFSKHIKLVYDSHELFTELPELNGRPRTRKIWLIIEKSILPQIKNAYTVCQSIADYYDERYKIKMLVIRNLPLTTYRSNDVSIPEIRLPEGKKVILYQGALNIGRGLEQMIDIMPYIHDGVLVIAGKGDIQRILEKKVSEKGLDQKVVFMGKLPFEQLQSLTKKADIGLVLQEDISLSYRYVLPNRLFDFIEAGVPVLASNLPEIGKIVREENIGLLVNGLEMNELLEKTLQLLNNQELTESFKAGIKNCALKYKWENDEYKLLDLFHSIK